MAGDAVNEPLIVIRAVHFAATAITTGTLLFQALVAEPALHSAETLATATQAQIRRVAWIGLAIIAVSGAIWVLLEAAAMSGLPFSQAVTGDVLSTVVNETQFGQVAEIRFALAIILAVCLAYDRLQLARWLALASALGLVAAIAWTGHAASTVGELGSVHLTADALHLIAAAAWTEVCPACFAAGGSPALSSRGVGTARARCDATLLDAGYCQCSHRARKRYRQRMDFHRLHQWADRYGIWASPGAQDCLVRGHGGVCGC